jgi:phosphohistidine swiveling domain-containing protein
MSDAGRIEDPADVFHLVLDELFEAHEHGDLVLRRREERERLAALRLPIRFSGSWAPLEDTAAGAGPVRLEGLGASAGVAQGTARVLRDPSDRLEAGEVLIAHVTDIGWTPLFAGAAAVVTDIGGALSHAAVVAREYGIPCVVSTQEATTVLQTGQLIEVDGTAGTVVTVD